MPLRVDDEDSDDLRGLGESPPVSARGANEQSAPGASPSVSS